MSVAANDKRRLNYLWQYRHKHDDDPLPQKVIEIRREIERIVHIVEDTPSTTKGTVTFVVAASDAAQASIDGAHYKCDGTNDEVEIEAALQDCADAGGGSVLLTEGTFTVGATVDLPASAGLQLCGKGPEATTIFKAASVADAVVRANIGSHDAVFRDFTIDGNRDNNTTGIGLRNQGANRVRVQNVEIKECDSDGLSSPTGLFDIWVTDCHVHDNSGAGMEIATTRAHVANCTSNNNDGRGYNISANFASFLGNYAVSNTSVGVRLAGTGSRAIGCYLVSNGGDGIQSNAGNTIVGNRILSTTGIGINNLAGRSLIVGNEIFQPGQHGIRLNGSHDSLVADNIIYRPGQTTTNTYDGLHITFTNLAKVWGNVVIGNTSASPKPRYGLNVVNSNCNGVIYVGNDVGLATNYGTGKYNDAGTGTVNTWPGAAAPQGDNF